MNKTNSIRLLFIVGIIILLVISSIAFLLSLGTIFYHWFSFCRYVQTSAASHIREAEESETETESEELKVKSVKLDKIDKVVEK